jgi:hypothetical protein
MHQGLFPSTPPLMLLTAAAVLPVAAGSRFREQVICRRRQAGC